MAISKLDTKTITAFIPGTIIDVKIKVGQEVKSGDVLVILDAMKMHNRILSQVNTTVKSVNVKKGDRVPKGFIMVELN